MTLSARTMEKCMKVDKMQETLITLRLGVEHTLMANQAPAPARAAWCLPVVFFEGDFVLVSYDTFHHFEKPCLRWCVPRSVTKVLSDFIFQVEDLRAELLS